MLYRCVARRPRIIDRLLTVWIFFCVVRWAMQELKHDWSKKMTYFVFWLVSIIAALFAWDHYEIGVIWYEWRELDSWKKWGPQKDDVSKWTFRLGPLELYRY